MATDLEQWREEDYQGLAEMLEVSAGQAESLEGPAPPEWAVPFRADLRAALQHAVETRNLEYFLDRAGKAVGRLLDQGVSFPELMNLLGRGSAPLYDAFARAYPEQPQRVERAIRAYARLRDALAGRAGEVYAARRTEEVEEEQRRIIRELSTPVVEVWEGILVVPIVGIIDSSRAKQMMEQLLNRIVERGSRIVILDVTGVPSIDTGVADHLLRTTRAARLVGARSILAGISPQVAVTLVRLGVSFGDLDTVGDLRSGLDLALKYLGYRVVGPEA